MAAASDGPSGRRLVRRFTRTERALHWVLALGFFALLASGLVLYLPQLSVLVALRPLIKTLHLSTGIAWLVALALVVAVGDRKSVMATLRELNRFDQDDRRWLLNRRTRPGTFDDEPEVGARNEAALSCVRMSSKEEAMEPERPCGRGICAG